MDFYTQSMMDIVGMPRTINIKGKRVDPAILFSAALGESLLYWHAASLSERLHGEVLLAVQVAASKSTVSGTQLVNMSQREMVSDRDEPGIGLAAGLMLLSAAGDAIIKPARKHANFDYAPLIVGFREVVQKHYRHNDLLKPDDFYLNSVFYDNIAKPTRDVRYQPPELLQGVKR